MKLPETSTSRYRTQAFCFKGSLIWNTIPSKIKTLRILGISRNTLKDGNLPAVVNSVIAVNCNLGFCYILTWFCWYLLVELFSTIL